MNISKTIWTTLLLGMGSVFLGCPKSPVENASSNKSEAESSTDSAAVESDLKADEPVSIVVHLPANAEEQLTEQQKFQIEARQKHPTTLRSEVVEMRFFKIEQRKLVFEAFGKTFTMVKTGENTQDDELFIWKGTVEECNDSEVEIRFNESSLWMNIGIDCDGHRYHLDSLSDGKYLLMEVDLNLWRPQDDQTLNSSPEEPNEVDTYRKTDTLASVHATTSTPILRVLVVFTTEAAAVVKKTKQSAIDAINSMNESFSNSHVDYKAELAGVYETDYQETLDARVDLAAFYSPNDGAMDEIHKFRSSVDADIAILVRNMDWYGNPSDELCGQVVKIDANIDTAFGTVYWWCMMPLNEKYSFAHEIGHLHGCRHQQSQDNSDEPFTYGHGFVEDGKWSTLMAIPAKKDCPSKDCDRINYWSNPTILKDGAFLGIDWLNDNAKVIENRSMIVSEFFPTPQNYSIPQDLLPRHSYKDFYATNAITNEGELIIESGAEARFRAKKVALKTGFKAKTDSKVTIKRIL